MINLQKKESELQVIDLGQKPYKEVWNLQKKLQTKLIDGVKRDCLLLVEHEPVYTLGKNADPNHLLQSRDKSINVYNIERGGDITFHGPGQLVVYPILNLAHYKKSISWYMRSLEQLIINVLEKFEIKGNRVKDYTGVWVGDKKIAAQGVRLSRWVTMHGFSINVNTDLSFYDGIIPCGIFDHGVTSIEKELNTVQEIDKVKLLVVDSFKEIFIKDEMKCQG
tara:strand:- start:171 stop:836 length:666 start_codon:yes stop_codon:yes gene_type:complete